MGVSFEITVVSGDEKKARGAIDDALAEIIRIENLISSWKKDSETSLINVNAGVKSVVVSKELFELVYRSKKISELTNGIFDISYASSDKIWRFDGSQTELPSSDLVEESIAKIGYHNIILNRDNYSIYLKNKGMKIGFGAIGKGYAANRAKALLQSKGIAHGVVNAGGDLITWGKMKNNEDWSIGIANPKAKEEVMGWIIINDMAVVTSGNYEKFFTVKGVKYSHIINPKTGYPATGTKSVTIICEDAELSDALATSVFILGKEEGIKLIDRLKNIECLIVTDKNELVSSKGLKLNYYKLEESTDSSKSHSKTIIYD